MNADESLRGDKLFMMDVLKVRPSFFVCATEDLKEDEDLALLSFAANSRTVRAYVMDRVERRLVPGRRDFVQSLRSRTDTSLKEHEVFYNTVLHGISDPGSPLRMLDEGDETAHKKLIADFLDIPSGKRLQLLRKASLNMSDEADEMTISW